MQHLKSFLCGMLVPVLLGMRSLLSFLAIHGTVIIVVHEYDKIA